MHEGACRPRWTRLLGSVQQLWRIVRFCRRDGIPLCGARVRISLSCVSFVLVFGASDDLSLSLSWLMRQMHNESGESMMSEKDSALRICSSRVSAAAAAARTGRIQGVHKCTMLVARSRKRSRLLPLAQALELAPLGFLDCERPRRLPLSLLRRFQASVTSMGFGGAGLSVSCLAPSRRPYLAPPGESALVAVLSVQCFHRTIPLARS